MNITNIEECIEEWDKDMSQVENNVHIPDEDKGRVLHEIDQLYNSMYAILVMLGQKPCVDKD